MLPKTAEERVQYFLGLLSDKNLPMSVRLSRCAKILAHCEKFKGTTLGIKYFDAELCFAEAMYEYSQKAMI